MAIIPAGFGQVNFRFTGENAPTGAEITLGFENLNPNSVEDCLIDFSSAWGTANVPLLQADAITMSEVYVKLGPNETGPSGVLPQDHEGLQASAALAPNVSILVQKQTALGGRKHRGRFFMPGAPEEEVSSGGELTGSYLNDAQNTWDAFLGLLIAGPYIPVVLHNDPTAPTPITSLAVSSTAATQRRRLRR